MNKGVLDELPGACKDRNQGMALQNNHVKVVHT
jgi:hypothetical protein